MMMSTSTLETFRLETSLHIRHDTLAQYIHELLTEMKNRQRCMMDLTVLVTAACCMVGG